MVCKGFQGVSRRADVPLYTFLPLSSQRHLQKSHFRFDSSIGPARHQAFVHHLPALRSGLELAVLARIEDSEVEALLIFHRGLAVRIEKITLVEYCIGDLFHHTHVHCGMPSSL